VVAANTGDTQIADATAWRLFGGTRLTRDAAARLRFASGGENFAGGREARYLTVPLPYFFMMPALAICNGRNLDGTAYAESISRQGR